MALWVSGDRAFHGVVELAAADPEKIVDFSTFSEDISGSIVRLGIFSRKIYAWLEI